MRDTARRHWPIAVILLGLSVFGAAIGALFAAMQFGVNETVTLQELLLTAGFFAVGVPALAGLRLLWGQVKPAAREWVAVHREAIRSMSPRQLYRLVLLAAVFPYLTRVFAPVTVEGTVAGFLLAALFVVIVVRGRVHVQIRSQSSTTNHGYRREMHPVRLVDE